MYKLPFNTTEKIYNVREFDQWHTVGIKKIQQDFLNGTPSEGCAVCFGKEITSGLRQKATDRFFRLRPDTTEFAPTANPTWLDLKFGNFCNLKCIMCHPESSSQIATEYQKNKSKFLNIKVDHPQEGNDDRWWEEPDTFNRVLEKVKHADYISLAGGEPFLVKQIFDILEHAPRTCYINISTNLTRLTDQHIDAITSRQSRPLTLADQKELGIAVSLDGIGVHHEYIRHGSDWETIDQNIRKIINLPNVRVIFTYLLQHTSIYTYKNFYNYIKQFGKEVQISTVNSMSIAPNIMTIDSVPPHQVQLFAEWYNATPEAHDDVITQWLQMYRYNSDANAQFEQYIALLDQLRGCNFNSAFNITS
jgi:sulfatase maturation enzyme AslB (radical SAM superfamily)